MDIIIDSNTISQDALKIRKHAKLIGFQESLNLIASPDTKAPLRLVQNNSNLTDGFNNYQIRNNLPILVPNKLKDFFTDHLDVPYDKYADPFLQYFLLASIKQSGEINALPTELAAQKHFYRMSNFLSMCSGMVLDVGCDDPILSASFFTDQVQYIGLDPFCTRNSPFRIIGVAEYLPFLNNVFDNVVFNTSLDHILDWRLALNEARRVLKPNGIVYISTYIWSDNTSLISDAVHFHHFRDYELFGALEELKFCPVDRKIFESPKGDKHRQGLYLSAYKY